MRRVKKIHVGERSAEKIKIEVGSAIKNLDNPPANFKIQGRHVTDNIPVEVEVSHDEVATAIDGTVERIVNAIRATLEHTPPELSSDLYATGIHLTGGGALLRGLDKRLSEAIQLNVVVEENPLTAVARGTSKALKTFNAAPYLI
jgi:rod shape-determining protein MreB